MKLVLNECDDFQYNDNVTRGVHFVQFQSEGDNVDCKLYFSEGGWHDLSAPVEHCKWR